jgi:PAS domain S-box-containing protein
MNETTTLRFSEARYQELIHALPAALYTCDERGRITLYNQAAASLWGREPEIGRDLWCGSWKIYRPDDAPLPLDECPMAVTLREGRTIRGEEIVIERPDGTRRHVLANPEPIRNAEGAVVGAINMLIDITDRKEGEQAIAKLAAIVTSSDIAIIGKDLRGIVTSWNRAAEHLFGYTAKEMIGQSILRLIPPERHAEESHILERIQRGESIEHYETNRLRKDGTELTVSLTVSPVVDPQGKIIGASKIARNITEQKCIEQALRRSERNLSDFFDNASVGLHWVGPDGIIIKVNQTELDLLGYSREEYVGHHIAEFHVDQSVILDILDRLADGETLREYPARIRCKDGSILDVLINSNVLFEEGKFIHTRCFTRDITDRKRAEEALRANEERFRTLADNISQFAWTADPTGWIFWYNRRWYEYTGTTFEEMQGWGWEKVHHPDHLDRVVTKWRQAHATGEPWEDTFPLRGLDGNYRWFLSRALPIRDAEGRIVQWFGTNTDVTEQREAEAALGESEQRYRTTFANAAVGIAHVGIDGRWLGVNDAVCRITGYGREELLMKPFAEITHPDDLDPEWANARRLLAGESATYSMEKRYIRKEGGLTWIHLTVSLQRDEAGSPNNFICIIEDITTRKQAEDALLERDRALTAVNEALKKHTMALADANKELEGFSYSVSHDLRAPLRTIDAFSRILEEDHGAHLNAEANRCLTIVRKAAGQAGELIDDLLEFSRLGRQGMNFHSVEMADLAREVADGLMTVHDGRQIDLTIGDLPSCQGDRRFLKLVWSNLLMNAFKYTKYRDEAKIEVGWMPNDASAEAVTYYVKDNGVGFDMKYAHKLFGVFQRLHQKEDFEGTGVGLAIVQRIVQRHGGQVWGEGKVDSGATFSFSVRKAKA